MRMTQIELLVVATGIAFATSSFAACYNPQNDPDVARGCKEYQDDYQKTKERRERDDELQKQDGQPHNEEQWKRNQYPQRDDDKYGIKNSHDQPQR